MLFASLSGGRVTEGKGALLGVERAAPRIGRENPAPTQEFSSLSAALVTDRVLALSDELA
ncbi:MAG: hypothetical protein HY720_32150 [Planctomycetes bacterium]|nr:hypothetical protein [Planctomycetota bacterium]